MKTRLQYAIVLLWIFFAGIHKGSAQEYSAVRYTTKDGLPGMIVYDITQDKDGFIWMATENGAARFDGINFKIYSTRDGLPDNAILKVTADHKGRVFFSPFTKPACYYWKDSVYRVRSADNIRQALSGDILFFPWKDNMIVRANQFNYIVNNEGEAQFLHKALPAMKDAVIMSVSGEHIIATRNDSIFLIDANGSRYLQMTKRKQVILAAGARGVSVTMPARPDVYLGGHIGKNLFYTISRDTISLYNTTTGLLVTTIRKEKASAVFIDNEDNLWITTLGQGVFRIPGFTFRNYSFETPEIFSLGLLSGTVYAGSEFSRLYKQTHNQPYFKKENLENYVKFSGNPVALASGRNRVYCMKELDGSLYLGTDAFLLKRNPDGTTIVKNIFPVKSIAPSGPDLLVCTSTHALLLNPLTLDIVDTLLTQRTTTGVNLDGAWFFGTVNGLGKLKKGATQLHYASGAGPALASRIIALAKAKDNSLWIATSGFGLLRYNGDSLIESFTTTEGLTSDICTSLYIQGDTIWLGTSNGLNRLILSGKEKKITNLTTADGLNDQVINAVLVHNGQVYAATPSGITTFPENLSATTSICNLIFLSAGCNNQQLAPANNFRFRHDALNIHMDFSAISFKSAGDIRYCYWLKGLEKDWDTTHNSSVNFSTLPHGEYQLLVKAINKFGVESKVFQITITVTPPWWQTFYFYAGAALLIGGIVGSFVWRKLQRVRKEEKNKKDTELRVAALEQKALQAQMNPHFIFNCLNSIQSFILVHDIEGANKYLTLFASLIRQTLDNSSRSWITLEEEIRYLGTYLLLEQLRFREKFTYAITVDGLIDTRDTLVPVMLLQPYVENALRHGIQHLDDNSGKIELNVYRVDGTVIYEVLDNGVGRKRAAALKSVNHIEYQSKGMQINEKRIEVINSQYQTEIKVEVTDRNDQDRNTGTIVTITIPDLHGKK